MHAHVRQFRHIFRGFGEDAIDAILGNWILNVVSLSPGFASVVETAFIKR
jgi:hypothetical protein